MAVNIDAAETLAELKRLGHNYAPAKQGYKSRIAGKTALLYDLDGKPVEVHAEYLEEYVEKGFTVEPGEKEDVAPARPADGASTIDPGDEVGKKRATAPKGAAAKKAADDNPEDTARKTPHSTLEGKGISPAGSVGATRLEEQNAVDNPPARDAEDRGDKPKPFGAATGITTSNDVRPTLGKGN